MKGTFEQAFKGVRPGTHSEQPAPWALGYQMREGDTGLWNNDLKARLLKRAVSEELGISDEEVEARLDSLQVLLPAIKAKLAGMRAVLVTRLVADIDLLPARLMRLKAIFPGAAAGVLAMREPGLVLGYDLDVLQATAEELRRMLPSLDIDRLVQENPAMLDVAGLKAAMAEAQRIMPHLDCERAMATDPQLIFGFQTGSQLIPYDPPRPVEQENDDDEYAAYYK